MFRDKSCLAPPGIDAHMRLGYRSTQEALREARVHMHPGTHPYRILLGEVRRKLMNTRRKMEDMLNGVMDLGDDFEVGQSGASCSPWARCVCVRAHVHPDGCLPW